MSLFGNTGGSAGGRAGGSGGSSKNLVECKAGKMTMQGRMVHPDKRKGLLYVHQSDDGLMHFCWKERSKSNAEDDLIIFPDDVEYRHVPQCTTGRVYVLKFKTSSRKLFFWMQEPKTDKDEENCKKINDFLNNPPVPGSNRGGNAGGGSGIPGLPSELANLSDNPDLQNILSGMNQQQWMHLISGMGGMGGMGSGLSSLMSSSGLGGSSGRSSATSVTSTADSAPSSRVQSSAGSRTGTNATITETTRPTTASAALPSTAATGQDSSASGAAQQSRIQLSDLQNILSSFGAAAAVSEPKEGLVDLSEGLNGELLIPLLAKPEIQERLAPFLPQGESLPSSEEELRQTIHSPQFQQAVRGFSSAFSSGQLGPLISQFGLGDDAVAAANSGDMCAFAKALQDSADKKKQKEGGESEEKSDDKHMDVDDDETK